jgi:hypothetical protein
MKRSFLPVADSQVYEHVFNIFLQIKKIITFEKLPVADTDSQFYERTVEVFIMFLCK